MSSFLSSDRHQQLYIDIPDASIRSPTMSRPSSIISPTEEKLSTPRRRPRALRWLVIVLKFLLGQWQIIGIGIAVVFAYLFPDVGRRGGVIESQYTISYGAIGIIFLVSGMSIPRQALIDNFTKWRLHLVVQVTSYLVCFYEDAD
jgi:solute carrier family 10 (sodium/bile acid cotransporter), member 7